MSNAIVNGTSYEDINTHLQAKAFQMPNAVDSASLYYGPTASDNRHSHLSHTMGLPVRARVRF